ncbi:thymidylate synthase [Spinactinospora alkalitolerans]|uniref:thymidylate synthase n=1 Tax=Spinactinospora alkalitolerans TaxID=687207 RepID=A0A852U1F7_9ACTN|nr:thymidylate synthase [Spinactinospora alkalitolerans]NYE50039.1 thymidylate synthase [Spinactinospora alkalitolerans]
MILLKSGSANELFTAAVRAVLEHGAHSAPRGLETLEVLGAHLCLTDPRRRLVELAPTRVVNPAFAAAEAVWILSGSDAGWIYDYNQRMSEFADDGVLLGAYGPRLRRWSGAVDQLEQVRRVLLGDPDTRRAVIQLYDPGRDVSTHKDVPCTLGFRFYLRGGRLHMHTTMRSQDLWLGFCYDVFTFTVLHELMAHWTGVEVGEYHHHVDSLHLYAGHWDLASRIPPRVIASSQGSPLGVAWKDFDTVLAQVRSAGPVPAGAWREFAQAMRSYRLWKSGKRPAARTLARATGGVLGPALESWYRHLSGRPSIPAR